MSKKVKMLVTLPEEIRDHLRQEAAEKNIENLRYKQTTAASLAVDLIIEKIYERNNSAGKKSSQK